MAQSMQSGDLPAGDEEDLESLPQDGRRPAYQADDVDQTLPVDHPLSDDRPDEHQQYDEGFDGAVGGEDPTRRTKDRPPSGYSDPV